MRTDTDEGSSVFVRISKAILVVIENYFGTVSGAGAPGYGFFMTEKEGGKDDKDL